MGYLIQENKTKTFYIIDIILLTVLILLVLYAFIDGNFIHNVETVKYVCNGHVFNGSEFNFMT